MNRLAVLATLMRAFAEEGDLLWTPRLVAPERMPDVPGVPRPLLVSGVRPTPADADLAWGDVSDIAMDVNDRRFALDLQRKLGCALPAAAAATDFDEADRAVAAAAAASDSRKWIVKAAHSAAGRGRVGARGSPPEERFRNGIDKLLDLYSVVVVEPWMHRVADYGASATVTDAGAADIALHALDNTARGDFRGIALPAAGLTPDEEAEFRRVVGAVGAALAERGYRGPFGVDAFRWRDAKGRHSFHPLCEINARHTFGWVARRFADRIAAATGRPRAVAWTFRLGDAAAFDAERAASGAAFVPLLLPGPPDGVGAWMTVPATTTVPPAQPA